MGHLDRGVVDARRPELLVSLIEALGQRRVRVRVPCPRLLQAELGKPRLFFQLPQPFVGGVPLQLHFLGFLEQAPLGLDDTRMVALSTGVLLCGFQRQAQLGLQRS